jgi:hypothetical protein
MSERLPGYSSPISGVFSGFSRVPEDVVDDVTERTGRVDHDALLRDVFPRLMETNDEVALGRLGAPFVRRALIKPVMECVAVDVEDEDFIEHVEELVEVAGAPAEESGALVAVGCDGSHEIDVPDVVFVVGGAGGFTCLWVALVREFSVAVDRVVATFLQLAAYRSLA